MQDYIIAEDFRLLYVAITRAEKELYMSYVDMYNNKTMSVSPFIDDIQDTISVIDDDDK